MTSERPKKPAQRHGRTGKTGLVGPELAVVVTDGRGLVTVWNEGAERLTGLSAQEMIGQPAWEICTRVLPPGRDPDTVRQRVKTMVGIALSTGQMPEGGGTAFRLRRADGVERDIEHQLSVVPMGDGFLLVGVAHDVTSPAPRPSAADASNSGFRRLLDEMDSGGALHEIITDEAGKPVDYRFLDVNPAFEELTGLHAADILGKRALEVIPDLEPIWIERYGRVALTGVTDHFESYSAALGRHYQVKAYCPKLGQFAVVFHDVTELRERSAFAETIIASVGEGLIVYDRDLRITVWNPVMEELTGLSAGQVIGRSADEAFPEVMVAGVLSDLEQALTGGLPTPREFEYAIPQTGRMGWVAQTNRPHRNANGEIVGVVSSVLDITAKHEIDDANRRSEVQFRTIFDNVGDGVAINDADCRFIEVNRATCERLGYSREEFLKLNVADINSPATAKLVPDRMAGIMTGGVHLFETTHIGKDGTHFPIEAAARLIEFRGQPAVLTVQRDISDRLAAQEALREQSRFLQAMLDAIPIPMVAKDRDGRTLMCNAAYASAGGITVEAAVGKTADELGIPDSEIHVAHDTALLADGELQLYDAFMPTAGHGMRLHLLSKAPLTGRRGEVSGIVTAAVDIHDRYTAEQEQKRSEERFRTLFEYAGDAIFITDLEGQLLDANQTACEQLGYSKEELVGLSVADIGPPLLGPVVGEPMSAVQELGSSTFETLHRRRDGTVMPVEMIATMIDLGGRPAVLGIARDITERKRAEAEKAALEDQLRQAQKMEGIGQLAGGIAHDFNNLLTAIRGNASLALAALPPGESAREDLEQIEQAADRAAGLTRQLLAFARRTVLNPETVDLGEIVRRVEPMLRRLIGEDVTLVTRLPQSACCVLADPGQLEQVIVNLAVNARDALPEGGNITLQVDLIEADESSGPMTTLSVTDTGIGMSDETIDHIFEPFYTTKDPGKGTGLGLSTVYGIVRQSGGTVTVRSELGRGSTLTVSFPRINGSVTTDSSYSRGGQPTPRRTGTIMVVEDDSGVRRFASRVLETAGFRIITAPDGPTAVATPTDGQIDLLLTDMVMPAMSGREVANRLTAAQPGLRVLFMSGHTDKGIVHSGILDSGIDFLAKPFTAEALLAAVDKAMAGG
ncbi:MAG TPA: PAS domain S-box protein [Candidatus Limnocylindrales bacterium]